MSRETEERSAQGAAGSLLAALGRTPLIAAAIGTYFAWWNLYHDEGFLFLPNYFNQVESCVACYLGALLACAIVAGLRASWERNVREWLTGLAIAQGVLSLLFYGAVFLHGAALVIVAQLLISASFFVMLFFLVRALASLPLSQAGLLIALSVGLYGLLESLVWAITMAAPFLGLRMALHLLLLGGGLLLAWNAPGCSDAGPVAKTPDDAGCFRIPAPLVLHVGAYWFVFGMTHALASGVIPIGHDKLLPCYLGSVAASLVFYFVFARSDRTEKIWPRVRAAIFPLTMLSFLLLPFANSGFTFISIGFAQCAMDTYLAFYLLATLAVSRKIGWGFMRTAIAAVLLAVPFIVCGVVAGDVLKISLPLNALFYNVLTVLAFALLVAGTFWVGDDRPAGLVWGLEKKLSPKRFEDEETAKRCAQATEKFNLTKREGEILLFLAQGINAAVIAETEVISLNTARTHIARIHRKMAIHNQQELLKRLKEL